MNITSRFAVVLCVLAGASSLAGQTDYETTEIADGIHQFRWAGHNGMFLVTDDGVVVFDPIESEPARRFAREIRRIAPGLPVASIVYSHSDADHATGARALLDEMGQAEAPIIAHENAVDPIRNRADPEQPLPTVTFSERMAFRVGGRQVELHYFGPSHTDNMLVAYIPDAAVAFTVDYVANDRMGYQELPGWHFPDFFDAVSSLLTLPFEMIVFGHGPPGDRASIHRQIAYWDDLTVAVRDAVARGWSEEQAAGEIRLPQYASWDRYDDWFPMNVRAVYRWISDGR